MKSLKRIMGIALSVCLMLTMCPFVKNTFYQNGYVDAASTNTDAMVSYANGCVGKSKSQLGLKGEWCASFVYYCAKNSGNSKKVGSSIYVGTQAEQTVNNKGGVITFVNKSAYNACKNRFNSNRCVYNPNYIPRKGDLYIQKGEDLGDKYFAHVGLVRKNSTKTYIAYTIEGNTSCSDGKHSNYKYVEYKTRNKNNLSSPYGFTAFVTPNYDNNVTHTMSFSLNGGTGTFNSFFVSNGFDFKLPNSKPAKTGYTFRGWYSKRLADNKWHVSGTGWCTWDYITKNKLTPRLYAPSERHNMNKSWTKGCTNSNYCFYAQWKANTWTVKYNANGGYGTMQDTKHTYGTKTYLRKNTFKRDGYAFDNWYVYRPNVNKWLYTNGSKSGWYKKGGQPSGYYLNTYYDGGWVKATTSVNNDTVILYAKWKALHTFTYSLNGGTGSFDSAIVADGQKITLLSNKPVRSGYTFKGWNVKRIKDNKWFVIKHGWCTSSYISDNKLSPKIYEPGKSYTIDSSWTTGCPDSNYCFYAKWVKK